MNLPSRRLLMGLLVPVSLLLGAGAQAKTGNWSDPSTWPDGKVPGDNAEVTIGRDMEVVLDEAPPALRSLTIEGKLSFGDTRDIELVTEWIYLPGGTLQIGTKDRPYSHQATITLTDKVKDEDINSMGDRGIMLMRGNLELHGNRQNSWTKLADTAEKGSNRITVLDASDWRAGDRIVLASTDFNPRQAEVRNVTAVSGNTLTLDRPLDYMHYGKITFGVDERGEVGLLNRNITIQASDDSEQDYFGGHIMAMGGSQMHVDSVELTRMGQHMHLARYPIHWHLIGEGAGQYIRNSAIHDTYSRCVTVHGTNDLLIENNVTYNTVGHCYFMEDGIETGNQFVHNLGIQTKCHPTLPCQPTNLTLAQQGTEGQESDHILIPSDNTVSTFWITNPGNIYRGNVAAGSDQIGFWMAFPTHPTGQFEGTEISAKTWPGRSKLVEFSGNVAHSNFDGLMLDRGPGPDGKFGIAGPNLISYNDPADTSSGVIPAVFDNFTGYKNSNGAIWGRGEYHVYQNLKLADNAIGFTHASGAPDAGAPFTTKVVDSLFVGESDNIGNPTTPAEIAYGRSLPKKDADFPIRGYEYYDFLHHVENTTFVNYQPNATREAGALSYLLFTSFGMSTENTVEGLTFVNAQPVTFPKIQKRWASDYGRSAAYRSAAFRDLDGSVGGIPGATVVIDNGIASNEDACVIHAAWNAAVCPGDMGRFAIAGNFSGFDNSAITDPIILDRDMRRFEYNGETTIAAGSNVRVETSRESLSLRLSEMEKDSFVIFELPGFDTSANGTQVASMDALRAAKGTSWFKDGDSLWVKMVVENPEPQVISESRFGRITAQSVVDVSKEGLGG